MKIKLFLLSLALLICLIGMLFFKDFFVTQTGDKYRNITDLESSYNADAEIAQALEKLKTSREKATVITHSNSNLRQIALTFDGLADRTIVQQILDLLKKYNAKATFFVDGIQTAEDPQTVVNIKKEGQKVENYTLSGLAKMENLPVERLVKDFCRAQKIIKVTTDQGPNLLKCNDSKYTDQLLQVAKACGFNSVVKSDVFVNLKQIKSPSDADNFVRKIRPGSIVSIKLNINPEPIVNEPGKTDLRPAIDKQPGLKDLSKVADLGEKEIADAVEKLLVALKKANYTTAYVEDFLKPNIIQKPTKTTFLKNNVNEVNECSFLVKTALFVTEQFRALFTFRTAYAAERAGETANEIKVIPTTEPALAYTFAGLSNQAAVSDVLGRLNDLGIKATFFVMETEIKKYPETVRKIIESGHEIGIAIRPKDGQTVAETRKNIMRCRKILEEQFGVTTNLVKQPWDTVEDTTKEAVASLGCKLIGQSVDVVQIQHKGYTSAEQVMAEIFGKFVFSLARGQIVHFRMDYYTSNRLPGDLVEMIKQRKVDNVAYVTSFDNPASNPANDSQYTIKPVGAILNNTNFIYQYPVDPQNVPVRLRTDRRRLNIDERNFLAQVSKRYIGHADVGYTERLLGYPKMDTHRLDTSGFINTEENVIFLTFDDWGTDAAINKILYVLRKHNVPATFFIVTNNVLNNPNLLRTIALEGHDIGSHSDQHLTMSMTQNKAEYIKDLAASYKKLHDVTGDVTVRGKPSLTRFFRSPTLTISKTGFEALFAAGYEYIIYGSCNTYDYKAESVPQLVRTIKDGVYTINGTVKKGAVLIMHMGDSCVYTAIALDILLTANAAKADSDPSKFKVGRLSDYLTDDYSQIKP